MTDYTLTASTENAKVLASAIVTVATTITLDNLRLFGGKTRVGIVAYSDAGGTTPVVPTSGSVNVVYESFSSPSTLLAGGTIDVKTPTDVVLDNTVKKIRATPALITGGGASHYQVLVTQVAN